MHRLLINKAAAKELDHLPDDIFLKIDRAIVALKKNPRPFPQSRKLVGDDKMRLKVGDYRVIYMIDDNELTITICHVRHRREAYR